MEVGYEEQTMNEAINSHAINYEKLREVLKEEAPSKTQTEEFLLQELPYIWREHYLRMTARETTLLSIEYQGFQYYYDHYTYLEVKGALPHSETDEDRVIGVIGRSMRAETGRAEASAWLKGLIGGTEERWGKHFDKGHFIAHSMGGGLQLNIFPQRRDINRGWSVEGKRFREMEKYCVLHPGTLCFHRPIYLDEGFKPAALDFGFVTEEGELLVERFDNTEAATESGEA
ncbi:MAG: hypothetical protein QM796_20550 [Chthoniobacteraceae bacterium]